MQLNVLSWAAKKLRKPLSAPSLLDTKSKGIYLAEPVDNLILADTLIPVERLAKILLFALISQPLPHLVTEQDDMLSENF